MRFSWLIVRGLWPLVLRVLKMPRPAALATLTALYLLATAWRAGSNVVESAAWQPAEAHRQTSFFLHIIPFVMKTG